MGDIHPVSGDARLLVSGQMVLSLYLVVIAVTTAAQRVISHGWDKQAATRPQDRPWVWQRLRMGRFRRWWQNGLGDRDRGRRWGGLSTDDRRRWRRGGVVVSEREDGGSGRHGGDYGAGDGHQD